MENVRGVWGYIGIYAPGCRGVFELILHRTKHTIIPPHIWTLTHVVPYTISQHTAYVRTAYGAIYIYSTHGFTISGFTRTATAITIVIRSNPIMSCPNTETNVVLNELIVFLFCFCMLLFYFIEIFNMGNKVFFWFHTFLLLSCPICK